MLLTEAVNKFLRLRTFHTRKFVSLFPLWDEMEGKVIGSEGDDHNFHKLAKHISFVVGCPVEGTVIPLKVAYVAEELLNMGCAEISLGDTIGVGTPGTVIPILEVVLDVVPIGKLAVHFNDTYGQALPNILLSLQGQASLGLRFCETQIGLDSGN